MIPTRTRRGRLILRTAHPVSTVKSRSPRVTVALKGFIAFAHEGLGP